MREAHGVDYERSDVSPFFPMLIGAGLAAFVAAVPLAMPVIYPQTMQRQTPDRPALIGPAPPLAVTPRDDLRAFRREEDTALNSYGWVDRGAGIVRIPIDRAMDLVVRRGLPKWQRP